MFYATQSILRPLSRTQPPSISCAPRVLYFSALSQWFSLSCRSRNGKTKPGIAPSSPVSVLKLFVSREGSSTKPIRACRRPIPTLSAILNPAYSLGGRCLYPGGTYQLSAVVSICQRPPHPDEAAVLSIAFEVRESRMHCVWRR